jgi:hypothetical protein
MGVAAMSQRAKAAWYERGPGPASRVAMLAPALAMLFALACAPNPRAPRIADATQAPRAPRARAQIDRSIEAGLAEALRADARAPAPASSATARALGERLARAGYFEATLGAYPESLWVIDGGPRARGVRLEWTAIDSLAHGLALPASSLPISPDAACDAGIADRIAEATAVLGDRGYPLARVTLVDYRIDDSLRVRLRLDPGPLARIERVRFAGRSATREEYLQRVIEWGGPETYRGRRWRDARDALRATGLFAEVDDPLLLLAGDTARVAGDSVACELLFRVRERRTSAVNALVGYANRPDASGSRARWSGFLDLALDNLLGTGRAARLFWQGLAEDQSRFELAWREPYLWRLPLGLDAALTHAQEDTLYAETRLRAGLLWKPSHDWRVGVGWGRSRLVVGGGSTGALTRNSTRFGLERVAPEQERALRGMRFAGEIEQTRGAGPTLRRATHASLMWLTRGPWRLVIEHQSGWLSGSASLLRSDVLLLGGARSLRGSYEGEFRATRFLLQRVELGPRLDERGGRLYLLVDTAWLQAWEASGAGLYGRPGKRGWHGAIGAGLQLEGRTGLVRLEYAVADGEPLLRGRLHLGVGGSF